MRKIIAHPVTWLFYYLGDIAYKLGLYYCIYHNFMLWSLNVQQWGGLESPWKSK